MIVVDSSVWIDFYNGKETNQVKQLEMAIGKKPEQIVVGDLVMVEVLQGFVSNEEYNIAKKDLESFNFHSFTGRGIAIKSAENYRKLRKKGVTIRKTIDCLIATFCIENGFFLLDSDRDFKPFEQHLKLKRVK